MFQRSLSDANSKVNDMEKCYLVNEEEAMQERIRFVSLCLCSEEQLKCDSSRAMAKEIYAFYYFIVIILLSRSDIHILPHICRAH